MKIKNTAAVVLAAVIAASVPLTGALNGGFSAAAAGLITSDGELIYDEWECVINDDDTLTIKGYSGDDTNVVIPGEFDGKVVTAIGEKAFYYNLDITSVSIPDSVTSIGDNAFYNCSKLENVRLSNSLTDIGKQAFYACFPLTNLAFPDGILNIGYSAFSYCNSLESIAIPASVTSLGTDAFSSCSSLTEINVAEGNTAYSSEDGVLFNKDKTILIRYPDGKDNASYIIPASVTSLECSFTAPSLTSVTIPASLEEEIYFDNWRSLAEITVAEGNPLYSSVNGVVFNKDKTELVFYPRGKSDTSYEIPNGVTSIGNYAFSTNLFLTSIVVSDGVARIGVGAFDSCKSLESVVIPTSVTYIGAFSIYNCPLLTAINYKGTEKEWEAIEIVVSNKTEDVNWGDIEIKYEALDDNTDNSDDKTDNTVTPGSSDSKQEKLDVTLKSVDSEKGLEGEALAKALFGDSGWTWGEVEKVEFTSADLFSVSYKAEDGWVTLGDETSLRAANDNIWNTAWTLNAADMAKDEKAAKVIAKDGTIDITAKVYIKADAEKPADDTNPGTGIALAIAPVVLAAGFVIVTSKKRK